MDRCIYRLRKHGWVKEPVFVHMGRMWRLPGTRFLCVLDYRGYIRNAK